MSIDKRGLGAAAHVDVDADASVGAAASKGEKGFPPHEGGRLSSEGIIVSLYPDYCLVDGVVVPFMIQASLSDAINTAKKHKMTGRPIVHKGTIIACCTGAEASDGGGVHSGTVNGACWPLTWSDKVRVEGEPVVRDGDLWAMNNGNTIGKLMFPSPKQPPDKQQTDKPPPDVTQADAQPNDAPHSQYDVDPREPVKPGALYARAMPTPLMRPAPHAPMRRGGRPEPIIPRRIERSPDPRRDPKGYRQYWYSMPVRLRSDEAHFPYPRRYWPNMMGDSADTSFRNPFIGQRQETQMPRPWSQVVVYRGGELDFGQGRVLNKDEFARLYLKYFYGPQEGWLDYNNKLQLMLQYRNPDLEIPVILTEDIDVETEEGFMANRPNPRRRLPTKTQELLEMLKQERFGDNNVRVTGRHFYCKKLTLCFAPSWRITPLQEPQRSQFNQEYFRQLKLQEQYMNKMKPREVRDNMLAYDTIGATLRTLSGYSQVRVRKDYRKILEKRYEDDGYRADIQARVEAEMEDLAVLHNPDMAAGGYPFSIIDPSIPIEDRIGWASVNSSIGGQWPSRRNLLFQHVAEQSLNNCQSPQVEIRYCQSAEGQPGVPAQP